MKDIMLPRINLQRCDRCGACVEGCPENALVMTQQGPEFSTPVVCTYCLQCEQLCPVSAIRAPLTVAWSQK